MNWLPKERGVAVEKCSDEVGRWVGVESTASGWIQTKNSANNDLCSEDNSNSFR